MVAKNDTCGHIVEHFGALVIKKNIKMTLLLYKTEADIGICIVIYTFLYYLPIFILPPYSFSKYLSSKKQAVKTEFKIFLSEHFIETRELASQRICALAIILRNRFYCIQRIFRLTLTIIVTIIIRRKTNSFRCRQRTLQ